MSPASMADYLIELHEHIGKGMKKGIDYDKIARCGPKPILLKPGAEYLLGAYNYSFGFELIDQKHGQSFCSVIVKAVADNPHLNRRVEGIGAANSEEKAKKKERETKGGSALDQWNSILKIAKKRALVDCALTATGASRFFTQDVDEDPERYANTGWQKDGSYSESPDERAVRLDAERDARNAKKEGRDGESIDVWRRQRNAEVPPGWYHMRIVGSKEFGEPPECAFIRMIDAEGRFGVVDKVDWTNPKTRARLKILLKALALPHNGTPLLRKPTVSGKEFSFDPASWIGYEVAVHIVIPDFEWKYSRMSVSFAGYAPLSDLGQRQAEFRRTQPGRAEPPPAEDPATVFANDEFAQELK